MAKKATLELEYEPKNIEFFGDYFIISYKKMLQEGSNPDFD